VIVPVEPAGSRVGGERDRVEAEPGCGDIEMTLDREAARAGVRAAGVHTLEEEA